jgi:hypothetical protein
MTPMKTKIQVSTNAVMRKRKSMAILFPAFPLGGWGRSFYPLFEKEEVHYAPALIGGWNHRR